MSSAPAMKAMKAMKKANAAAAAPAPKAMKPKKDFFCLRWISFLFKPYFVVSGDVGKLGLAE